MVDVIKELCNHYRDFDGLGSVQVAFTNNATTTTIVKNVLVQSIGSPKKIDLLVDGKPVYKGLIVPRGGTIKLENENLIIAPSSTLSYRASVQNDEVVKPVLPANGYVYSGGGYIDNDGKMHTFYTDTSAPYFVHYVDGSEVFSTTTTSSYQRYKKIDACETSRNVFFVIYSASTTSPYSGDLKVIKYDKVLNESVLMYVHTGLAGGVTADYSQMNPKIKYSDTTGMLVVVLNNYTTTSIRVYFTYLNTNGSNMLPYPDTYTSITTTANNSSMNFEILNNGNVLIAHGSGILTVLSPRGTTILSGSISGMSSGYNPSLHLFDDDSFIVNGNNGSNFMYKYSNDLTLLATSVASNYYRAFVTPIGDIVCSNSAGDIVILDQNDLTVKNTYEKYLPAYSSSDFYSNSTTTAHITDANYYTKGQSHNSQIAVLASKAFYNAINIKIDGVEVTDA